MKYLLTLLFALMPTLSFAGELVWYGAGMTASTVYDVESTFYALQHGKHEGNLILRPFIRKGRVATYSYELSANALIWLAMRHQKQTGHKWKWLAVTVISTHTVAGIVNFTF